MEKELHPADQSNSVLSSPIGK